MQDSSLRSAVTAAIDEERSVDLLAAWGRVRDAASKWHQENADAETQEWVSWEGTALLAHLARRPRGDSSPSREPFSGLGLDDHRANLAAVDYWCERSASCKNSAARARYADLGWTVRSASKDRRAYPLALVAIDAYLAEAALACEVDPNGPLVDALDRAAQIACLIKDRGRARKVADATLAALTALPDDARPRWCLELFDTLDLLADNFDSLVEAGEVERLERALLETTAHFEAKSPGDPFLPVEALASAVRAARRLGARDRMIVHRIAMAELMRRAAVLREGVDGASGGAAVASGFMESALHLTQQVLSLSPPRDVQERLRAMLGEIRRELRRLIRATEEELKRHRHRIEFEFPREEHDAFLATVLASPPEETIPRLIRNPWLHLPLRSLEAAATNDAKTTWVSKMILPRVLFRQGRKRTRPPAGHDPKREVEELIGCWLQMHLYDLEYILSRLQEAGRLTVEGYVAHFDRWDFLDEADRPFLATGIERYLSGDYVSALHVLVPRIEHMLKSAFEQAGLPPIAVPNETEVKEQTFGDFLRRDEVRHALGDDLWSQLYFTLLNENGMNLRNNLAHGWIRAGDCNRGIANLAVFLPLLLTVLAPKSREPVIDSSPAADAPAGASADPSADEASSADNPQSPGE